MATINLVTGYTGEAHIKSEEDALLNRYFSGQEATTELYIIDASSTFDETDCDIDCDVLLGGRLIRTDGAVNLTFTKPSSGYYRYDNIYVMYKKHSTGIEEAELIYCEGTESQSQATAEENAGTPPSPSADIVTYEGASLCLISWDNAQHKTVQSIDVSRSNTMFHKGETYTYSNPFPVVAMANGTGHTIDVVVPLPKSLPTGCGISLSTIRYSIEVRLLYPESILSSEVSNPRVGELHPNYFTIRFDYSGGWGGTDLGNIRDITITIT